MTVAVWLKQWLDEAQHVVARKTHERYDEIVTLHLIPALGAIPLAKLAPVHIQTYYTQALECGRRDGTGGLSAQTVVHHARVLSAALGRARALRLIATNPIEDTSQPQVQRQEIEVLEPAEAATLLSAARGTRMFQIIFLALATGLRRSEILGLRWSDVDLARRTLTVAQALEQTTSGGLALKYRRRSGAAGPSPCPQRSWRNYRRTGPSRAPSDWPLAWGATRLRWRSRALTVSRCALTASPGGSPRS